MLKLTAYLCILGYLMTPAFAQQQLFYPLPQTAPKPASSNPWGLKPLSKPSATKPATQPAQQYRPPYYPPPPPTYLPSQLNPNAGTNQNFGQNYNPQNYNPQNYNPQNYAKPSPSPPASTSDTWGSWKNNGGAFRFSPGVDFSTTYGDVVVAINSMGTAKVKTVGPTGTSSWVTLAQSSFYEIGGVTPVTGDFIESRPSVTVSPGGFQVFVTSALGRIYALDTPGTLPLSQLTAKKWIAFSGGSYKDPASVYIGSNYYVFVIGTDDKAYYNSITSGPVAGGFTAMEAVPKLFTFNPAAATYMSNGVGRVVVAAVTYDGTLNIYDSTPTVGTPATLVAATFNPTDISCIDSPQAVGLGDHVEVYCRGKDMQFYCVTVMQGGVGDTRILPEADVPDVFKPVFNSMTNTVTVYSKTPAGRVVSKPFQNYSPRKMEHTLGGKIGHAVGEVEQKKDSFKDKAHHAKEALEDGAEALRDKVKGGAHDAKDKVSHAAHVAGNVALTAGVATVAAPIVLTGMAAGKIHQEKEAYHKAKEDAAAKDD